MPGIRPLYWNHVANYEECPQKALWYSGWDGIDLGRGVGRGKPRPKDKSRHHAIMGIVIQSVLEDLYNNEQWRHREGLQERLVRVIKDRLAAACVKEFVDWKESPPYEELEETCINGVIGYLKTMKAHKLLGPYARAEVPLLGHVTKWLPLGGKADVIIRREDTGVLILDGKNSMTKMTHVDPDQLRWYALCYALSFHKIPERLAFVWYRYPYNETTGEQGIEWVPFTRRDLRGLIERGQNVRMGQRKEIFPAKPAAKVCKFCDFESVCPERQAHRQANVAKRNKGKLPIVGQPLDDEHEIVEFGFGTDDPFVG